MLIYNIGFINTNGEKDKTQLDIRKPDMPDADMIELINLILSLKDEMDIKEIVYIDCVGCTDEEDD